MGLGLLGDEAYERDVAQIQGVRTVFSQHSPWNPLGCLLSNLVPGSNPD